VAALERRRRELRRDQPPAVGFRDLEHLGAEFKDALRSGWPANSERSWREFLAREQAPPGARLGNREAAAQFEVLG